MSWRASFSFKTGQLVQLAAMALVIALLTFNRLGASDVCGGSEAVMGVFVQQMVEHDQLLFPLDNCKVPMYKPPLFHWTSAAISYVAGHRVTALSLRLPSALYATAGAILTMIFATYLMGASGGLLSGAILAASYQYISQGRIGLVDMTLAFFETSALMAFFCWFSLDPDEAFTQRLRKCFHYLAAISMGLGVLAKGPVGALLPGLAMLVFLAWRKCWRGLQNVFALGPLVAGGTIASSWYLICLIGRRFDFLSLQIGSENFGRFFGDLGSMRTWYYLQPLLLNSIPLSLLVPVAVATALASRVPLPERAASHERQAALCTQFFAVFWIVTVIFFNLAAYKRRAYLLPLWPASAVLLSWWVLNGLVARHGRVYYRGAMTMCLLLAAGNFFFIPAYELRGCGKALSIAETLRWPVESLSGRSSYSYQSKSFREAAARVNRIVKPSEPLQVYRIDDAIEPLVFYLNRCVSQWPGPIDATPPGYLLTSGTTWPRQRVHASELHFILDAPYRNDGLVLLRVDRMPTPSR